MRRRLPTGIRWFVAIGLVAIVVTRFDVGAVATRIGAANLLLAVPAIGGLVAIHLVGAVAWRRLLEEFGGIRTDWRSAVRLYYAAQAVGSITPGNLGADVYRIAAVDAASTRRAAAVPILLQRVTSTAAMVLLGAAGLVTLGSRELVQRSLADALPLVVAAVSIATVVVATGAVWFRAELLAAWAQGREHLAGLLRNGLGLGLLFHAASIGLGWVLVAAIDPGTASRSGEVLAILAVARLSVVLPLSPAGLGVQEAAVGVLFAQVGLDPQVALAAILLNRVALLVVVVLGAAGLLRGRAARARVATAPTATMAGTPQPAPAFRQARTRP
jgi:glycosyltransferase 2 family protein